jgi:hypothetical protein
VGRSASAQTAAALPQLSLTGIEIPARTVVPADLAVRVVVDLGGDVPTASYMTARPRGMPALQRTADGAWIPWDQRNQSLIDNRFTTMDGTLVFAESGADFSHQAFPVELEIAYRTLSGLKFGLLTLVSRR